MVYIVLIVVVVLIVNMYVSVSLFSAADYNGPLRVRVRGLVYYLPFARAKGEVFVLLYVCLFVRSTISQQPAGRFTPNFACVGSCLLPFWGSATPWGAKRGEMTRGGLIRA